MVQDFNTHKSGDTWKGISSITFTSSGTPVNLSGALVHMQVRLSTDSPAVMDLSLGNGIYIVNSYDSGTITIPKRVINFPVGNYKYEIELTLPNGDVNTFLEGSWPITADITRS
jgi:hypothetical protein